MVHYVTNIYVSLMETAIPEVNTKGSSLYLYKSSGIKRWVRFGANFFEIHTYAYSQPVPRCYEGA